NPTGINQFEDCHRSDDNSVEAIIRDYDHRGIMNWNLISEMLLAEHNIHMSATTVAHRRGQYGLKGSGWTTKELPLPVKRQLVLDKMAKDPTSRKGPKTIIEGIGLTQGIHLTHEFVHSTMHTEDPKGFSIREPSAKKIKQGVLTAIGPHQEWSGDGHDKLAVISFPIWGCMINGDCNG
ncbi:hypothetical protein L208DRAFT_1342933, partial [Tricholoma matsutake]